MSSKPNDTAAPSAFFDVIKWLVTLVLLLVAIGANWYFGAQYSAPVRAVGVIIVVIVALLVWKTTRLGGSCWGFCRAARTEMRKVVWPTRKETLQSTFLVIAIVALVALLLWGVDSLYAFLISHIII